MAEGLKRFQYDSISDSLGKGNFGEVFRATDTLIDKVVALKISNPANPQYERYSIMEEFRRIMDFRHENLIAYYYVFETEGHDDLQRSYKRQVAVMEYIDGADLQKLMDKEAIGKDEPKCNDIITGILQGLHCLHSNKIIHRDLKPSNILIEHKEGRYIPKITDFGISKEIESSSAAYLSEHIGTSSYMAPEQFGAKHSRIDHRIDIWAFGIILYELFSGKTPFERGKDESKEETMRKILLEPLPPALQDIPEPYRSIIEKCLQKKPEDRFPHARDILDYLKTYPEEQQWQEVNKRMTIQKLKDFLRQYPNGRYSDQAGQKLQNLLESERAEKENKEWQKCVKQHTVDDYQLFITTYPSSDQIQSAVSSLTEIIREQCQAEITSEDKQPGTQDEGTEILSVSPPAIPEESKAETQFWNQHKNKLSRKICREYLNKFPGGIHRREVIRWRRKRNIRRTLFILLLCALPVAAYFGWMLYLSETEKQLYQDAAGSGDTDKLIGYIQKYPDGKYRFQANLDLTRKYDQLISEGEKAFDHSARINDITMNKTVGFLNALQRFEEAKKLRSFLFLRDTSHALLKINACRSELDSLVAKCSRSIKYMNQMGLPGNVGIYQMITDTVLRNPLYNNGKLIVLDEVVLD
ncbi:MAG: serine/threonine protein kinase [Bacteroidales bacterium]|nr:serine/threonine protein kinase [Bacteroidales bacterium]